MKHHLQDDEVTTDIEVEWSKIKRIIENTALEVLGLRNIRKKKKGLYIWNEELGREIEEKRHLYLKWMSRQRPEDKEQYQAQARVVKNLVRQAHRESWDKYVSNIEHDIHGRQTSAYKIMKHLNKEEKDAAKSCVF